MYWAAYLVLSLVVLKDEHLAVWKVCYLVALLDGKMAECLAVRLVALWALLLVEC